jgi:predicted RNA-binding protein YlqC (UPF0109 family)
MFKDLVEYIVKALVDYPDQVEVTEIAGNTAIVIEVSVAESDMGRVIGKRGRVINSIRAIVDVLAAKQGKRINLEILED